MSRWEVTFAGGIVSGDVNVTMDATVKVDAVQSSVARQLAEGKLYEAHVFADDEQVEWDHVRTVACCAAACDLCKATCEDGHVDHVEPCRPGITSCVLCGA